MARVFVDELIFAACNRSAITRLAASTCAAAGKRLNFGINRTNFFRHNSNHEMLLGQINATIDLLAEVAMCFAWLDLFVVKFEGIFNAK